MKAEIELNGALTINFDENINGRFLMRWAMFWPEQDKNPSLALQMIHESKEETIFSKQLNKQGKETALKILDSLIKQKYFHITMPGKRMTKHINRRHEISSLNNLRGKVNAHMEV